MNIKPNVKKIANIFGNILTVLALLFLAKSLYTLDVDFAAFFSVKMVMFLFICAALFAMYVYLNAFAWYKALCFFSKKDVPFLACATVYTKANIGKYIPGNVMHFVGRNAFGRQLGCTQAQLALGTLLEIFMCVFCGAFWSFALARQTLIKLLLKYMGMLDRQLVVLLAFLAAIALAATVWFVLKKKSIILNELRAIISPALFRLLGVFFLIYSGSFVLVTGFFVLFLSFSIPIAAANLLVIASAYIMSWLIGFVVPGSPGGIGVREAVLLFTLGKVCPAPVLLGAVVIQRLISVLGDMLAWIAAVIMEKRSGKTHD